MADDVPAIAAVATASNRGWRGVEVLEALGVVNGSTVDSRTKPEPYPLAAVPGGPDMSFGHLFVDKNGRKLMYLLF